MIWVSIAIVICILVSVFLLFFGRLWIEANSCGADVSMLDLICMPLRGVSSRTLVSAKIMATQAGIDINRKTGLSTRTLEAHMLSGGDIMSVISATIAARYAQLPLNYERAMSIDLAGRDITKSVKTTVLPIVIHCPDSRETGSEFISGVSKDGIELRIRAWITVRTNLDQLIGGATESTIIARVGQGIISAIGAAESFRTVLETPSLISQKVLERGLDANTAFAIVSVDIVNVSVGNNIGAGLLIAQAEADMLRSKAEAESRRSMAAAREQEMVARIAQSQAALVRAEAAVPLALALALINGNFNSTGAENRSNRYPKIMDETSIGA